MILTPSQKQIRRRANAALAFIVSCCVLAPAYATTGSGMPWEAPLNSILQSIQGPVVRMIAIIIIAVTGLSLAFGETSGFGRRLIQIVFGITIAFEASDFFLTFFNFTGGAVVA